MKTILVAIDFSDVTNALLERAESLARAFDGELYLVHVEAPEPDFVGFEPGPQHVRDRLADEISKNSVQLIALRDSLRDKGVRVHSLLLQGGIAQKLHDEAVRLNADCIVLGSHGRGALFHMLLGSVSNDVIRSAKCPILIIPGDVAGNNG